MMSQKERFRTAFADVKPRVAVGFLRKSRTNQDFAAESDITLLVARYRRTGYYYDPLTGPRQKPRVPLTGDFSGGVDFATAQEIVRRGNEAFASIPAHTRRMFDDDPALFLQVAGDPAKVKEFAALGDAQFAAMKELGLIKEDTTPPVPPPAE